MTVRIPKPVLIAAGVILLIGIGALGGLLLSGEDDGDAPAGEAASTTTESDEFTSSDLEGIDRADSDLDNAFNKTVDSLGICTGSDAQVADCVETRFATVDSSFSGLEFQLDQSAPRATGQCGDRIAEARSVLVNFKTASDDFRESFAAQDFTRASPDALVSKYSQYRSAMDKALITCADDVPGAEVSTTG